MVSATVAAPRSRDVIPRAPTGVDWREGEADAEKVAARRDVRVARVAAAHNGVIATRQLAACGLNAQAIRVRVARGNLHPVFRGVYAVGHDALTHTGLFTAAVLACGAGAVLSHRAAAAHHGLLEWDGREVEVIVPRAAGRRIDGIRAHRQRLDQRDVWKRANIRITSPERTILDVAAGVPRTRLRRAVRQAFAERRVSVRRHAGVRARTPRHPGAAKLRALLADGYVPTRSELEDLGLDLVTRVGIERPEINSRLRLDGRAIEPDMLWRSHRLAVELDSRRWHDDALTLRDDADRQAILEAHGHHILRITWHQILSRPTQTVARIGAALEPVG
ncbi:MAG TPA: type IV toxin-antitoxin system AbiEi family antitoxin domain-containing protein [Solirubrobacteraceae bacterium]|nr:type IV toxin-antitoxin system AbiEi family antitoxin domain-containing protein [Solirubrobacteraceae bacterium]